MKDRWSIADKLAGAIEEIAPGQSGNARAIADTIMQLIETILAEEEERRQQMERER